MEPYSAGRVGRVAAQGTQYVAREAVHEGRRVDGLGAHPVGVDGGVAQPAGSGLPLLDLRGGPLLNDRLSSCFRLPLDGLLRQAHGAELAAGPQRAEAVRVLHRVLQLVGEQPAALVGAGPEGALAEEDVLADRDRVRAEQLGQLPGVPAGVQPYPTEIVSELLLQLTSQARVEGLSGAADDVLRLGRTGRGGPLLALAAPLLGGLLRTGVLGPGAHRPTSP